MHSLKTQTKYPQVSLPQKSILGGFAHVSSLGLDDEVLSVPKEKTEG